MVWEERKSTRRRTLTQLAFSLIPSLSSLSYPFASDSTRRTTTTRATTTTTFIGASSSSSSGGQGSVAAGVLIPLLLLAMVAALYVYHRRNRKEDESFKDWLVSKVLRKTERREQGEETDD